MLSGIIFWVRFTYPRFREDQLQRFAWKVLIPLALLNIMNDYDGRNVWLDGDGRLHLLLTERDGRWTSADIRLTRSLGYGTYSFDVRDTSQLDPSAAFSMYTFDPLGSDQNFRELTVDVSRWGEPGNMLSVWSELDSGTEAELTIPASVAYAKSVAV